MNYVSVSSLEKYQHYKDRHMVWFKFYLDILQNFQFMELTEKQRWVFIGVICLACKNENKVPLDEKYLDRTLNTKESIKSIDTLTSIGLLSTCYQDAIPIREEKIREEKKREDIPKIAFSEFVNLTQKEYDTLVAKHGERGATAMVKILNDAIGSKGYKYKSHYHTINGWVQEKYYKNNPKPTVSVSGGKSPQAIAAEKQAERDNLAKQGVKI